MIPFLVMGLFFDPATAHKSAILNFMRFAPLVSMLVACLTLNAQTIQGKVVRVADGDTIRVLESTNVQNKCVLRKLCSMKGE